MGWVFVEEVMLVPAGTGHYWSEDNKQFLGVQYKGGGLLHSDLFKGIPFLKKWIFALYYWKQSAAKHRRSECSPT